MKQAVKAGKFAVDVFLTRAELFGLAKDLRGDAPNRFLVEVLLFIVTHPIYILDVAPLWFLLIHPDVATLRRPDHVHQRIVWDVFAS